MCIYLRVYWHFLFKFLFCLFCCLLLFVSVSFFVCGSTSFLICLRSNLLILCLFCSVLFLFYSVLFLFCSLTFIYVLLYHVPSCSVQLLYLWDRLVICETRFSLVNQPQLSSHYSKFLSVLRTHSSNGLSTLGCSACNHAF